MMLWSTSIWITWPLNKESSMLAAAGSGVLSTHVPMLPRNVWWAALKFWWFTGKSLRSDHQCGAALPNPGDLPARVSWLTLLLHIVSFRSASPYGADLKRLSTHGQEKFLFNFSLDSAGPQWPLVASHCLPFSNDSLVLMLIDKHRGNCEDDSRLFSHSKHRRMIYWWLVGVCFLLFTHPARSTEKTLHSPKKIPSQPANGWLPSHTLAVAAHHFWFIVSSAFAYDASWADEGIHPGCSVLTLMVIAHFCVRAFCNGPSPVWHRKGGVATFFWETFSRGSIVTWGVMGLEPFQPPLLKATFAWAI